MHARKQKILDLFGVEVPDELFDVWAWHQALARGRERSFVLEAPMSWSCSKRRHHRADSGGPEGASLASFA